MSDKKRISEKLKIFIKPFLNWKFLLSFGLSWVITNGWSFIFVLIGTMFNITWMITVGGFWIGVGIIPDGVWILCSIPLAIVFQTKLFPHDEKLNQELLNMKQQAKEDWNKLKRKLGDKNGRIE